MLNEQEDENMGGELVPMGSALVQISEDLTPTFFREAGPQAAKRFIEFFVVNIRNPNTRAAYYRALRKFAEWCEERGLQLETIEPTFIAMYIEQLRHGILACGCVKQIQPDEERGYHA